MYNYEQFKYAMIDELSASLNEKGYEIRTIEKKSINKISENIAAYYKNNSDISIAPLVNIEDIYELYKKGERFDKILSQITEVLLSNAGNIFSNDFTPEIFKDKGILDNLTMDIVNTHMNQEMLQNVPSRQIEDLSVIYRMDLSEILGCSEDVAATVLVDNNIQKMIGLDTDSLHEHATKNMRKNYPVKVTPFSDIIKNIAGEVNVELSNEEDFFYIMQGENYKHGASSIVYGQDKLNDFLDKKGKDIYIIPSSIYEVLIIPDNKSMSANDLREMVKQVNNDMVDPGEKLSDNVYKYTAADRTIKIAMDNERTIKRGMSK